MSIYSNEFMVILYVNDQDKSKDFYRKLMEIEPRLDVPGMTEFQIAENVILGIMQGDGIVRILEGKVENPNSIGSIPRCELYLYVDDPDKYLDKLLALGGQELSRGQLRNWGDFVAYGYDLDNNVLAFAIKNNRRSDEA